VSSWRLLLLISFVVGWVLLFYLNWSTPGFAGIKFISKYSHIFASAWPILVVYLFLFTILVTGFSFWVPGLRFTVCSWVVVRNSSILYLLFSGVFTTTTFPAYWLLVVLCELTYNSIVWRVIVRLCAVLEVWDFHGISFNFRFVLRFQPISL